MQYVHQLERAAAAGERHASKRWQRWSTWALGASALVGSFGAFAVHRFNQAAPVLHALHSHQRGNEVSFFLRPTHFQSLTLFSTPVGAVQFAEGGTLQGERLLVHALCRNKVLLKRRLPNNGCEQALVVRCGPVRPADSSFALQFADFVGNEDEFAWHLEFVQTQGSRVAARHHHASECTSFRMRFGDSYLALILTPQQPPCTMLIRASQIHHASFDTCFFLDPTRPLERLSALQKIAFQFRNALH